MRVAILAVVGLACLAIGAAVWLGMPGGEDDGRPAAPAEAPADGGLSGIVSIGLLLPLTGGQSTHGEENVAAAMLAIEDINAHLETLDEDWRLDSVVEDTATSPVIATEKLAALNARGTNLVIGPETSAEIRAIKGYSDSSGMLLFSPSSTAPSLAIPNDSVYRMITDDTKQGPALAALAMDYGSNVLIPVWRGDAWGDGLAEAASGSFAQRGGTVDEGIRYNPESTEFSATISLLAERVEAHVETSGADGVAVLLVAFAEALPIMQTAAAHDILDDVRWIGTGANAKEHKIVADPVASTFSDSVMFTAIQVGATHNAIYKDVSERLGSQFGGREPNGYAFTTYDATWVLGLSVLHAGSADPADVKRSIPTVAAGHSGAIGSTRLNDAGDLAGADYDFWLTRGGEWVHAGKYILATDTIVPDAPSPAGQ